MFGRWVVLKKVGAFDPLLLVHRDMLELFQNAILLRSREKYPCAESCLSSHF
jgi:hypothetical protein